MEYVFAPTNNGEKRLERNFESVIKYIGSKQSGLGSNLAKGKRFIKNEIDCTGAAIKHLYKSVPKLRDDSYMYGLYVYKYNDKCCAIVSLLMEYIEKYIQDRNPREVLVNIPNTKDKYFDWLFLNQYGSLYWASNHYKKQHKKATDILQRLDDLR